MRNDNVEIRTLKFSDLEIKRDNENEDNSSLKVSGYALNFDSISQVLNDPRTNTPFVEIINKGALDNVDLSNVLLLYSHDFENILARTDSETLTLNVDEKGLFFNAVLPDTQLGHDVYENIKNGNLKGCSFRFEIAVNGDSWSLDDDGMNLHTITSIENVSEISITSVPAYSETSVGLQRSLNQFERSNQELDDEKKNESTTESESESLKKTDPKSEETKESESEKDSQSESQQESESQSNIDSETEKKEKMESTRDDDEEPDTRDDEDSNDKNGKGEDKKMPQIISKEKTEEIRSFEHYMKTGEIRDGVTTVENQVVIPKQILKIQETPNDPTVLSHYVNRTQVVAPMGSIPVVDKNNVQLVTEEELKENPELEEMGIKGVDYKVATYRGVLPASMEILEDVPEIETLINKWVDQALQNTEQFKIGALLQTATPVTAKSIDDLKDAYNIGLSNYSDRMWVLSESMYALIDKQKDNDGRYLFQESIASASGQSFLGRNAIVVADQVLGKSGESHAFVGSVSAFAVEAVKNQVRVGWADNDMFGKKLAVALRADFKHADTLAGKFITWSDDTQTPPENGGDGSDSGETKSTKKATKATK